MLYTIKQGAHYASPRTIKLLDSSKPRSGTFVIKNECWYDTGTYGTHLNKLIGVGCDLFNSYSYRLAWRPADEPFDFEVYIYLHIDGKWVRSSKLKYDLCGVVRGEATHTYAFDPSGENIRSLVNGEMVERHFPFKKGNGWLMETYFGGSSATAPWAMQTNVTMEGVLK